jgi:hypothetical protein
MNRYLTAYREEKIMITDFQNTCVDYLKNLHEARNNLMATDELSLRPALDTFLKQAVEGFERLVQFVGEGKKIAIGKPDFTVTVDDLPIWR